MDLFSPFFFIFEIVCGEECGELGFRTKKEGLDLNLRP
jgi:hypothetical protein